MKRALAALDVSVLARRAGGHKESTSVLSFEWLFPCWSCGSSRLRYNHAKGAWKCWKCGRSGDTLALVAGLLRIDDMAAAQYIVDSYVGGDAPTQGLTSTLVREKPAVRTLPVLSWPEGVEVLGDPSWWPHERAWRYLTHRELTVAQVHEYRLGFGRVGRCENRIVFPCYMDGALVYWQARATWDPPPGEERGTFIKSINPVARTEESVHASEILFNYDRARIESHVVVCEGPIDAIKVGPHALALLGKAPTPAKVERIRRTRANRVTIYLDRGETERRHAHALAEQLAGLVDVFIAVPPEGYDPGALDPTTNAYYIAGAVPYVGGQITS